MLGERSTVRITCLGLLLFGGLAGCATTPPAVFATGPPVIEPFHSAVAKPTSEAAPPPLEVPIALSALPGWGTENHSDALDAVQRTCHVWRDPPMVALCEKVRAAGPLPDRDADALLESTFQAVPRVETGLLTAYFAPIYEARTVPTDEFSAPVRPVPAITPLEGLPERAVIDAWPTQDALAWMRPEDLFFLQIQGSGLLTFEDGHRQKVLYAATNGQPFIGIARIMREMGLLADAMTSGDNIRTWLAEHRGEAANQLMRTNPRYAFFRLAPDDGVEPAGAAGLPLPPGRSAAIDPAYHQFGELWWIDAEAPKLTGAFPVYRRLVVTLDTGGAIKGDARADLFTGVGPEAGSEAGRVRHNLRIYRLVPRAGS